MGSLTIGWEYLTGYAVATDPSNRERAEWPPHPARVFMALAAAWFETGEEPDEGVALRWLEGLEEEPELWLPGVERDSERSEVTVYVPVNDKAGPSAASIQSVPSLTRSKQPRSFPRIWLGYEPCYLHWPNASGEEEHRDALDRLCQKVTRVGHSSSLVRMWVDDGASSEPGQRERWTPESVISEAHTRQLSVGMLDMLVECYGEASRRRHAEISTRIDLLRKQRKQITGKGAQTLKAEVDGEIEDLKAELEVTPDRPPVPPTIGLWSGYCRASRRPSKRELPHSHFDTDILVLAHVNGPQLPVVSTLAVTQALRNVILKHAGDDGPVPAWISGHESSGDPAQDADGHLALIPLPFAGTPHADGHLLGVGFVFPRSIDRRDRGRVLGSLLVDDQLQPLPVDLTMGRLGVWTVQKRDWMEPRDTLQPETWTADPSGASTWASATPVVLDRFPKADRSEDRVGWTEEVAEIIRHSCVRIGLPEPVGVDIDTTSWHRGAPRAVAKHRRLRGQAVASSGQAATLGDGFPAYPPKGTNAPRPQVHLWLQFDQPVVGPILLGAGRYRGYGLLKPWKGGAP